MSHWEGLTSNLALIVVATLAWSYAEGALSSRPALRHAAISVIAAVTVVVLMLLPVQLEPGIVFDLRVALISVVGAFAGPVPASVTALLALALRWTHGGVGVWAGLLSVMLAWIVGYGGWRLTGREGPVGLRRILALSVAAGSANALCLIVLPHDVLVKIFPSIGPPAFFETIVGVVCAATLLNAERRRRDFARSSQLLHAVVEALPDCLHVKDRDDRFVFANSATAWLMGHDSGRDLIGKREADFLPAEMIQPVRAREEQVWATGKAATFDQKMEFDGTGTMVLRTLKTALFDDNGRPIGLITHNRDVSGNMKLRDELAETHRRLEMALDNMADGLVQFDAHGSIVFCNQRYCDLFPKTSELRVPGANIADIIRISVERGEEMVADDAELDRIVRDGSAFVRKPGSNIIHLDGDRWLETRTTVLEDGGSLSVLSEVTERMRTFRRLEQANEKLAAQAMTDGLTGLSNRRYFDDKFEREFQRAAREGLPLGLVLGDIDHFKAFNDAYGHLAGDDCLRLFSSVLRESFSGVDATLARFGGEEFIALLSAPHAGRAREMAETLRATLERSARPHAGSPLGLVTVSVGVFVGRPGADVTSAEQMISLADATLYLAKRKGRNRVQDYKDGTLAGRFAEMRTGIGA